LPPRYKSIALTLFILATLSVTSAGAVEPTETNAAGSNAGYDPAQLQTYYKDIWSRIRKTWWVPEELLFKQVKVRMTIEKDGKLSALTIATPSGDSRADTLALIGIKRAAPFGPLPEGLPVPFNTVYTIGFKSHDDKDFRYFDGKRYGKGESYTLPTGTKVGHADGKISELDKQFHLKKEAALIKMNKLDDGLAEEDKAKDPTVKKANLLIEYAGCLSAIQEQGEAKTKLTEALEILDKTKAADLELYPCLSQLAQLDYSIGDLAGAEPLFKRALEIKDKSPTPTPNGTRDPEYKSLLEQYAKLLYKQNRAKEADELYKKIKDMG
jgi:TonB family protein